MVIWPCQAHYPAICYALRVAKRYQPVDVVKASVWVKPEVLERARNAVVFVAGELPGFSFVKLLDEALTREIARLERKYRGGRAFPARTGELRRGARSRRPPTA